jgi:anti-anti-sigma regulatory factor
MFWGEAEPVAGSEWLESRVTLAINLQLSPGRLGASARVELHVRREGTAALVRVRGRLESVALARLGETLEDLAGRGVRDLLLDCSQLRDIRLDLVASLIDSLAHFEARSGRYSVCGLSPQLRDRFRFAGCENGLHPWPPAPASRHPSLAARPSREWAS